MLLRLLSVRRERTRERVGGRGGVDLGSMVYFWVLVSGTPVLEVCGRLSILAGAVRRPRKRIMGCRCWRRTVVKNMTAAQDVAVLRPRSVDCHTASGGTTALSECCCVCRIRSQTSWVREHAGWNPEYVRISGQSRADELAASASARQEGASAASRDFAIGRCNWSTSMYLTIT